MKEYLTKIFDWQTDEIAGQYNELPLWSSPFGLLLMDNFPIGEYKNYLDIGFGTGFPLIEISQRLGTGCKAVGIDPWSLALREAEKRIEIFGLKNIELIEADASSIPFPENHFDLITSNLGVNNFDDPLQVLKECHRVLKPNSALCTTSNLEGCFKEFFEIFEQTLGEMKLSKYVCKLHEHIKHRGTIESHSKLIEMAGFNISKRIESNYHMRYLTGTAFLNHTFIILGFIRPWREMFAENDKVIFFEKLEENLNEYSKKKGELNLNVPMVYFECLK